VEISLPEKKLDLFDQSIIHNTTTTPHKRRNTRRGDQDVEQRGMQELDPSS
jgi:hypothetical protein